MTLNSMNSFESAKLTGITVLKCGKGLDPITLSTANIKGNGASSATSPVFLHLQQKSMQILKIRVFFFLRHR